jgi:hypothetical protein
MISNWQRRRGAFNHDWLKNQYLLAIDAWINLQNGEIANSEFEKRFIQEVFIQWESGSKQALALVKDFEIEMSPRRLFELAPLARSDDSTKLWLAELIHDLWRMRQLVDARVSEARIAIESANAAYARIQGSLKEDMDIQSAKSLHHLEPQFSEFRILCIGLAKTIEAFPSEVKIA